MNTPSYRWAFVDPAHALKYVADPALVTYADATHALQYASGSFVIVTDGNRVVAAADADDMLREFACNVALSRLHEWDAPDVVKEYLTTRNPDLREAAWDAAWTTARSIRSIRSILRIRSVRITVGAAWTAAWAAWPVVTTAIPNIASVARRGAWDADQLDTFLINQLGLPT